MNIKHIALWYINMILYEFVFLSIILSSLILYKRNNIHDVQFNAEQ